MTLSFFRFYAHSAQWTNLSKNENILLLYATNAEFERAKSKFWVNDGKIFTHY